MSEVINDCKVCPRYLKTVCVKMCSYLRLLIVPSYQGCEVTGFVFLFRSNLVSPPVGPPLVILLLHFRAFSLSVSLCVCVCVCMRACAHCQQVFTWFQLLPTEAPGSLPPSASPLAANRIISRVKFKFISCTRELLRIKCNVQSDWSDLRFSPDKLPLY